jgi:uncharacterized BrkB/YihY/UPF0761 family membrane protein
VYYAAQIFLYGAELAHVYALREGSRSRAAPTAIAEEPRSAAPPAARRA